MPQEQAFPACAAAPEQAKSLDNQQKRSTIVLFT
jgi:hypothetical protein